ncbi:MAG: transposase [Janthinobacterium lividum]
MKSKLMFWMEKILLRKRGVIESVFHVLKNGFELEHIRH